MQQKNPFYFGGVVEGSGFINRSAEIRQLRLNFSNGINTMLISPRRWGKSSLVQATVNQLRAEKSNLRFCMIDLFGIRGEEHFYEVFVKQCLKTLSSRSDQLLQQVKGFLGHLMPQLSFSPVPGQDEFNIRFSWKDSIDPSEILDLPDKIAEKFKTNVVVCIDEFQNISNFRDPVSFQKLLRSHWQHHRRVSYCLYGSKRHVLNEFFNNQSMPFYRFGDILFLDRIPKDHWISFIADSFNATGKEISAGLTSELIDRVDNNPHYIQQYAYYIWNLSGKVITGKDLEEAMKEMILHNRLMFLQQVDGLTETQIGLLRALADGEIHFNSQQVLEQYKLGTSGNATKIRRSLEKRELIDCFSQPADFEDPLFRNWFRDYFKS